MQAALINSVDDRIGNDYFAATYFFFFSGAVFSDCCSVVYKRVL